MDRLAQKHQADEIATRLEAGESVTALAAEYGLHRQTIWRRANQGIASRMPDMDDRDGQRAEINALLWAEVMEATDKGDVRSLVPLLDRMAKMNGLDHTHRVEEAKLQLDAARVTLLAQRMAEALKAADIPPEQQVKVLELVAGNG